MADSKTEIVNLALSHLGVATVIANFDSDQGPEAATARVFYNLARKNVLRDINWPFARRDNISLALIEEFSSDEEYKYSYTYPANCLKFIRVLSDIRTDNRQSRVTFKISSSGTSKILYTDRETAKCEYIFDEENTLLFPIDFDLCLSYKLAAFMAPRLTAGDPFKLGPKANENYLIELSIAAANSSNEEQPDEEVESEFQRDRY